MHNALVTCEQHEENNYASTAGTVHILRPDVNRKRQLKKQKLAPTLLTERNQTLVCEMEGDWKYMRYMLTLSHLVRLEFEMCTSGLNAQAV